MGSGFRTFTAGEVLTASNVQNYLQDQVVMTFAGSAARSSAIGTANFEEGMTSYLTDTDQLEVYNGTNWVGVAPASTQGLTLINTTSFSGVASTSFPTDSLSATYENYRIIFYISDSTIATGLNFRLRTTVDETGSQYYYNVRRGRASGVALADATGNPTTSFALNSVPGSAGRLVSGVIDLITPQLTGLTTMSFSAVGTDGTSQISSNGAGYLNTATQYQSATLFVASGNITGKMALFGYNF